MPEADLLAVFVDPLERLGFRYMVTGSAAAMLHGEPRLTNDVDIVLELDPADATKLRAAFTSDDYHCPQEDEIRIESARPSRGHVNILHVPTALEADIYFAGDEWLHRWALPRSRAIADGPRTIRIAPPEYVIVRKLAFYREGGSTKHVRDVRALLSSRKDELDFATLRTLLAREGLIDVWREVSGEK